MEIMSLFTQPHIIPNLYCMSVVKHYVNKYTNKEDFNGFCLYNESWFKLDISK